MSSLVSSRLHSDCAGQEHTSDTDMPAVFAACKVINIVLTLSFLLLVFMVVTAFGFATFRDLFLKEHTPRWHLHRLFPTLFVVSSI